eukprot:GHVH01008744.1.p1 GENE.GHVH01008744.1~~GHVH01008744.1.p1  ORF type:complete len:110 (-),score=28.93 GHVH01008744.1:63-392(-)
MTIDEPDTPFIKYCSMDSEEFAEISDFELEEQQASNIPLSSDDKGEEVDCQLPGPSNSIVHLATDEQPDFVESREFKEKRAKHYNEFLKVREMRERMARGELSDEEDEE